MTRRAAGWAHGTLAAMWVSAATWAQEPEVPAGPSEDTTGDTDIDTDTEEPLDERAARRQARREARAARWEGPILPPEADFLRTHTTIAVRLAFNGTAPGPFSLFTALAGWNEFSFALDRGLATWRDFTISMGFEGHYGAAWVPGALNQRIADTEDVRFRWAAWEAGGSVRMAFHFTRLSSVDPWFGGAFGANAFRLRVRVADPDGVEPQSFTLPYLRGEIAGGINLPMQDGFVVGVEVRYLITGLLQQVDRLRFALPDDDIETFVLFPQHRPPKGFSWVVTVGYRF